MAFNQTQRALHYTVCGPNASVSIQLHPKQLSYGANFLTQIPSSMLPSVNADERCGLGNKEMRYFIDLAQRRSPL
ncbi:hypothetical protein IMCC21906_02178 [Spongiibacter sp. IMCC21906]|jgi:hypothetical protein|uniref:hypothetical protein n=1 Tax=Spongiibacter sp. IMCC21906 TaxID=1620392 RepID=UPI00062DEABD|nr:hypothetical protein [Spongiibacter sp. IMCC21906]AKH69844.1 hypothetical protein IMCC21906_02178 [Spongiibacter sp. IMCC21906]